MKAAFFALAMFVALPVFAAESLQTLEPTTLFDGPSKKANPRFILSGGYPLKEISRVHGWRKVLIFSGEIGWVREKKTRPQQAVVVKNNNAAVRFEPSDDSPPIFSPFPMWFWMSCPRRRAPDGCMFCMLTGNPVISP